MLSSPAPLLPELGEAARARRVSRRFSETRQGLGDEGEGAGITQMIFNLELLLLTDLLLRRSPS
jgi:hypothetical protein